MRVMLVEDHDDLREATLAVLLAHGFHAVGVASASPNLRSLNSFQLLTQFLNFSLFPSYRCLPLRNLFGKILRLSVIVFRIFRTRQLGIQLDGDFSSLIKIIEFHQLRSYRNQMQKGHQYVAYLLIS